MFRVIAVKYGVIFSIGLMSIHYGARGFVACEDYLAKTFDQQIERAISLVAERSGYEPKQQSPLPQLSLTEALEAEALAHKVNPALARAVAHIESRQSESALSSKGAIGVMQVMPANHKRCGLKSPGELWDMRKNIRCGVQILSEELDRYKSNPFLALQSYNGGPAAVGRYPTSIKYSEMVLALASRDVR